MVIFLFQFLLTNFIFSTILCGVFIRLDKDAVHSPLELFLYSLGVGPIFTTLLLYYLLLFIPHHSNFFYFLTVLFVYVLLFTFGKESISILWVEISSKVKDLKRRFKNSDRRKKTESVVFIAGTIILISALIIYLLTVLKAPLSGVDALRYGNIGNILFKEKSMEYRWISPHPETGYYFWSNHAPSFSLFFTWSRIIDSFFKAGNDLYYKSNTAYYTMMILFLLLFWLSKKSKYLAVFGSFLFLSGLGFTHILMQNHLDFFRIFFLVLSWIFLAYAIDKRDSFSLFLLGLFSGFVAFAHTIGAVLVFVNIFTLFIFLKGNLKYKLSKTFYVIFLTIVFGWIHYIIDIIWGFGWLIFVRGITYWG